MAPPPIAAAPTLTPTPKSVTLSYSQEPVVDATVHFLEHIYTHKYIYINCLLQTQILVKGGGPHLQAQFC